MPDPITDPRTGSIYCFDCGHPLKRKGICWNCYDLDNQEPEAPEDTQRFKDYRGDRWIVDDWIARGRSEAQAIAGVQIPWNINKRLCEGRLDAILADRYASEGLRQLLIAKDKDTLEALAYWIEDFCLPNIRRNIRFKRGPKPMNGIHIEHEVLRMKREGKTNGEIAKALKTTRPKVAAAYNNITNKIAKRQQTWRDNYYRQ
jgi:hypothetical protein